MKKVKLTITYIIEQDKDESLDEFNEMLNEFKDGETEASNGINIAEFYQSMDEEILSE